MNLTLDIPIRLLLNAQSAIAEIARDYSGIYRSDLEDATDQIQAVIDKLEDVQL